MLALVAASNLKLEVGWLQRRILTHERWVLVASNFNA